MIYLFSILLAICVTNVAFTNAAHATTYYVRDDGNDSLDGRSHATAWRTVGKVNSFNFATGDDVYFLAGDVWSNQRLTVDWNGTSANRAIVGSYYLNSGATEIGLGGHARPVLDDNFAGRGTTYAGVITVAGDYLTIENFETREAGGLGVQSEENLLNVQIRNIFSNRSYRSGIRFNRADTILIENCEVYNANVSFGEDGIRPWANGIQTMRSRNVTIRGNTVREGWGEGIDSFYGQENVIIEDNLVFAHHALGIYVDSTINATVRRNRVIGTTNTAYHRSGSFVGGGIIINNEAYQFQGHGGSLTAAAIARNVKIYDNLVAFASTGIGFWGHYENSVMSGMEVYNNTLVDNGTQFSVMGGVPYNNSYFRNNILLSLSSGASDYGGSINLSGLIFSNNYFSRGNPGGITSHSGNVYTGIQLAKMSGWRSIGNVSQIPSAESFRPTGSSSTLGRGTSLMAEPFNIDFMRANHRNPMDMGAISNDKSNRPPAPQLSVRAE